MTRALLTGITGFVSSHLADYLLENTDWQIVGTHRWRSDLSNIEHLLPRINAGDRVSLLNMELRDAASVRRAVRDASPDYVFHLAAQSFPKTSFESACDTYDTNCSGTERLLDALVMEGYDDTWVHVCSSSEVYGKVPAERLPITEDCPFHPASPYAISKVGADLVAQHYAEAYGLNVVVTRMFTHTGPRRGDVFAESSFAKQIAMIEAGQLKGPIQVGNLLSMRTVADVRDAVRAYHMALTVNPVRGAIYNIGGATSLRVGEILDALIRLSPRAIGFQVDAKRLRPIDADNQVPDCTRFISHTGWSPMIPFEQTIADLLAYWRAAVKTRKYLQR